MRSLLPLLFALGVVISGSAAAQEIDWQKVDTALGRKAAVTSDVHRYGFPRTDISVTLNSVTIKPALALGGYGRADGRAGQTPAARTVATFNERAQRLIRKPHAKLTTKSV